MSLNNYSKYNKGMTLVELMVVLSIFAIISAMVMFNYSDYKTSVTIKVLADDIALSVRQAQAYAIGVKSVNGDAGSSFPGYGIHFNTDDGAGTSSGSGTCGDGIDNDGDGFMDSGDSSCIDGAGNYDSNLLELPKNQITYTCNDGSDNDGDGFIDSEDSSCIDGAGNYDPNLTELAKVTPTGPQCSDGVDNVDRDGFSDMNDPECHGNGDPNDSSSYNPTWDDESNMVQYISAECFDKTDNEFDGRMDYDDPDCHSDGNPSNPSTYDPNINTESGSGSGFLADCNDGVDNDNDGSFDDKDSSCYPDFNSSPSNNWAFDPNMSESRVSQCNDRIDNNSDGRTDSDEMNCHTDNNFKNSWTYNPMNDDEDKYMGLNWTACTDGWDNNGNGMIDYDEPNCHSDLDPNNPNSYNPNINDEDDFNKIVFNLTKNLFKNLIKPINKIFTQSKKVFADDVIPSITGDSKSFVLFADVSCDGNPALKGNKQYDYPNQSNSTPCGMPSAEPAVCDLLRINAGSECISITNIIGANKIYGICVNQECEDGIIRRGTLDIVFTRPNPDASFCYKDVHAGENCTESESISHAGIIIQSIVDNRVKKIVVWTTGQISVN